MNPINMIKELYIRSDSKNIRIGTYNKFSYKITLNNNREFCLKTCDYWWHEFDEFLEYELVDKKNFINIHGINYPISSISHVECTKTISKDVYYYTKYDGWNSTRKLLFKFMNDEEIEIHNKQFEEYMKYID